MSLPNDECYFETVFYITEFKRMPHIQFYYMYVEDDRSEFKRMPHIQFYYMYVEDDRSQSFFNAYTKAVTPPSSQAFKVMSFIS